MEANHKWPTCGPIGYKTLAASGVPNALKRGENQKCPQNCAGWPLNPNRLGGPKRFEARDKITASPQVGHLATQPLPLEGVPNTLKPGTKLEVARKWARCLNNKCRMGGPQRFTAGDVVGERGGGGGGET